MYLKINIEKEHNNCNEIWFKAHKKIDNLQENYLTINKDQKIWSNWWVFINFKEIY